MKTIILLICVISAIGCAGTNLYNKDGRRIAAFQGDMTGVDYSMAADGSIRWKAATVDHSSTTKAQKEGAAGFVTAAGVAVAGAGITNLLK